MTAGMQASWLGPALSEGRGRPTGSPQANGGRDHRDPTTPQQASNPSWRLDSDNEHEDTRVVTLREARVERLLSIRELAKLADVAPSTVYLIEVGRSRPRLSVARRIAEALRERPQDIQEFQRTIDQAKVYVPRRPGQTPQIGA